MLLPIGALQFVRTLGQISNSHFLLLSADKAHSHEEDLRLTKDNPHLAIHGSFSFMTNFHAMHQYFVNHGGESLHTPYFSGLQVAAFIMGSTCVNNRTFSSPSIPTASRNCSDASAMKLPPPR